MIRFFEQPTFDHSIENDVPVMLRLWFGREKVELK